MRVKSIILIFNFCLMKIYVHIYNILLFHNNNVSVYSNFFTKKTYIFRFKLTFKQYYTVIVKFSDQYIPE